MKQVIKEYLIRDYISKNNKTPSQTELNFAYKEFKNKNILVEEEGLMANERESYCQANSISSAKKYNEIWKKCFLDIDYLIENFANAKERQRLIFNDRLRNLKAFKKEYSNLERKINFSILNFQNDDIFSYEIVEDFKDLKNVDLEKSNIHHLDNEKITIGVNKTEAFSIDSNEISFSLRHRKGTKRSERILGSLNNALVEDSSYFRIESSSDIGDDIVELIIELNLKIEKEINEIKYITVAEESNSRLMEDCYYSLNGTDYIHIDEYGASRRVVEDRNYLKFNDLDSRINQKIKKIKLVLRKTSYDYEKNGIYYYNFGLDFIGYLDRRYNLNSASVLYTKAYEVLDENNMPYNFGIAKIDKGTCCEIPEMTSIDMFLSKDNINFIKADFNQTENNVIQFDENWGDAKEFEHFEILNLENESDFLLDENLDFLNLNETQKMFNLYLAKEQKDNVNLKSLIIKRNVLDKAKNSAQSGVYTGWIKEDDFTFKCKFKCSNPEGRIVDFGSTVAVLDGTQVKGKTFIKYGVHKIKIDAMFFNEPLLEQDIKSVRSLKTQTVNYPYDHRFIIEGFNYGKRFKGERIFSGFSDQRGCDLQSTSLNNLKNSGTLEKYSIIDFESDLYFVVNEIDGISTQENYDITYRKNTSANGNLLFIKAILKTKEPRRAPNIDKIQVRVL